MKQLLTQGEQYDQINAKSIIIEESQDESDSNSNQMVQSQSNEIKKANKWTQKEDEVLKKLVQNFGEKNWRKISSMMEGRSAIQCLHRWSKILKPGLVKGPWTSEEDEKLLFWVQQYGPFKWSQCSELITGRSGKQCRERWFNNLNPNVKKGNWTQDEDNAIFKGYLAHGSSWSRIAKDLEGRTENSVKNRFYSTVRKLLSDMEKKGKYVNQNNENDIKNIISMTLQEYQANSSNSKDNQHDLDQDDLLLRKQSTSISNGVSVIQENQDQNKNQNEEDNHHLNENQQDTEANKSNEEKQILLDIELNENKNDIIQENNLGLVQNEDENSKRNRFLSINSNQTCSYELGLQDQIEKHNDYVINLDGTDGQNRNLTNNYENQISQLDNQQSNNSNSQQQKSLQQNQLLQQNNLQQQQESTLKLKDEYSQQNFLYRLILEGNVSIKKTTSMRDYSLYQKNKAKSRNKKYQRQQQDNQQKYEESSPLSQKDGEQYQSQSNSQFQFNSKKEVQQGNDNSDILSKGQKLLMQIKQLSKMDDSQQKQNIYNNYQDSISQQVNREINSKNIQNKINQPQLSKKGSVQNIANNSKILKQENLNNLSQLLKEKLMNIQKNNFNNQKTKQGQDNNNENQDDSNSISRSSSMSKSDEDLSIKNNMKMKQLSSIQKAQQLQKEIEEKKKQLLMLNLEQKIEKKNQKSNLLNTNQKLNNIHEKSEKINIKNMLDKSKNQSIQLKEEQQEDYYNEQYDNILNKKKNVMIDHEQQKKIIQKMLKNHNEQKLNNQISNDDSSSSENQQEIENSFKSKKKLKLYKKLKALQQQKQEYQNENDNNDSDFYNSNNEDELNFNEEEEDNNVEEEEQEEQKQSEKVQNKLMKYLSTSFAKIVQSITKKVNKKYKKDQNKNQFKIQNQNKQLFQKYMQQKQQYLDNFNKSNNKQIEEEEQYLQNSNKIKNKKKQQTINNYNTLFNELDFKKKIKKEENSNERLSSADENLENISQMDQDNHRVQSDIQQYLKNNSQDHQCSQKISKTQHESQINSSSRQKVYNDTNIDSRNISKLDTHFKDNQQESFTDKTPRNKSESFSANKNHKQNEQFSAGQQAQLSISKQQSKKSMKMEEEKKGKNSKKNTQDIEIKKYEEQVNKKSKVIYPSDSNKLKLSNQNKQIEHEEQIILNKNNCSYQQNQFDQNNLQVAKGLHQPKTNSSEQSSAVTNSVHPTHLVDNTDIKVSISNNKINNDQTSIKHETELQKGQLISKGSSPSLIQQDSQNNKAQISIQTIIDQLPKNGQEGDDRIDYLISQLKSLENLLNTTKSELNKLESTIHVTSQPSFITQKTSILSSTEDLIQMLDDQNRYHTQANHSSTQQNYTQINQYPICKSSQHSENSQCSNYQINNAQNQHHHQLFQSIFECNSDNNLSNNARGGKFNHHTHQTEIVSMEFGFYNKYNDEVSSVGQEQEKEIYITDNLSESQGKDQAYKQKNQLINSNFNNQSKSVKQLNSSILEEEKKHQTGYTNKQSIFFIQKQNEQNTKMEEEKEKLDKSNNNQDQTLSPQSNDKNQQELLSDDMLRIDNNSFQQVTSSCNLKYGKSKQQQNQQNTTYVKQFIMSNGGSGSYLNEENNSQIQLSVCDD